MQTYGTDTNTQGLEHTVQESRARTLDTKRLPLMQETKLLTDWGPHVLGSGKLGSGDPTSQIAASLWVPGAFSLLGVLASVPF